MDIRSPLQTYDGKHRNRLFEAAVMFVAAVILVVFVAWPKYQDSQTKADELSTAEKQFMTLESDRKTLAQLASKIDSSREEIALADQAIPLHGRITALNLLLDNMVVNSGMQLASLIPDEGTDGIVAGDKKLIDDPYGSNRKLQTIATTMTVTGPVEQFRQLLKLIETSPRLMDVDNISISKAEELVYKVHLKAYFYAPEYEKKGIE